MQRALAIFLIISVLTVACQRDSSAPTPTPQSIGLEIIRAGEVTPNSDSSSIPQPGAGSESTTQPTVVEAGTPLPSATPYASAMPLPTPRTPLIETYVVQWGDTLSGISLAFDVPITQIAALNGLDPDAAVIHIGQALLVPLNVSRRGPEVTLLPDSELVFSPAYLDFDVRAFVQREGGYLSSFSAPVNEEWLSGAELVSRVARQYSVGPRVLLTVLEHFGGWVTQPEPKSFQPLGTANPYYEESFFLQLSWAANRLNEGYYDYKQNGHAAVRFSDGGWALVPSGLNAGTAGIESFLATNGTWDGWERECQAFMNTYRRLFGDPNAYTVHPLVPADLQQPVLDLPWEAGVTFYYTGGPHAAYGSRSAWAAVDFAPPDINGSCFYSTQNVTAAADGRLLLGEKGETYLDLDKDGNLRTGWVLLYLHVVPNEDIEHNQNVAVGTPIGYASCEGGISNSSHVHLARRFNGEWMAVEGPVPLVLSGWQFKASIGQYDGTAIRDGTVKTACECSDEALNALLGE